MFRKLPATISESRRNKYSDRKISRAKGGKLFELRSVSWHRIIEIIYFPSLLFLLSALCPGGSCLSQTVKINELMYAPKNGAPEWLELFNCSPDSVNINGWKIRNKNARSYILTGTDFYVAADSYLVITKSDTLFSFYHAIHSRVLICSALPSAFMVNTGDTISIHDSTGNLVDSVFYQPSWGASDGKSLERISAQASPFLSTNWSASVDSSGCTPGRRNSVTPWDYDLKITRFSASIASSSLTAVFRVSIMNSGLHSTSPFNVKIFLDYNNDSAFQADELANESDNIAGLNPGDSTELVLTAMSKNMNPMKALALIEFPSDQNLGNNLLWTNLYHSYQKNSLVVNEIMYAPKSPEPEWVELYNVSEDSVNLAGFTLSDNSGMGVIISNGSWILAPNDYAVVAHDSGFFGIHPAVRTKVLIAKIPSLNNTGDVVAIHDASGGLIDSVNYLPSWGGNTGGRSLERILPAGDSGDPQNFETSADSSGSTPAKINSATPRDLDLAVGKVAYLPCPPQSGESVVVSASIVNRGLKSSGREWIEFFADQNGNGCCDHGVIMDSIEVQPLNAGDSTIVNFNTGILSSGVYRFGIMIICPDDELQANNMKTFFVNVGLPFASIVINEIMYAPKSPEQEWLEFYNNTDAPIDLGNFKIETHGGAVKIPYGSEIPPKDFAVVCKDSSVCRLHYPVKNIILRSVPSLSNSGDWVALYDSLGILVDSVNYVPSYGGSGGRSLERVDCLAGDDSTNWQESVDSTGATPGIINSNALLPCDISLKRLNLPGALEIGQPGTISLIVRNCGRNSVEDLKAALQILNTSDDSVVLSSEHEINVTLAAGDTMVDDFCFTPSQSGEYIVLGRISQPEDQRQRNDTLSARLDVCYRPQTMVINEIMYSSTKMGEYFEIYNASESPVQLAGWTFHTASTQSKPSYLSSAKRELLPAGYFVVGGDSLVLACVSDTGLVQITKSLTLRDDGGDIVLSDPSGSIVDSVYYLPSWHSSDVANTSGRSLERINPELPSNSKTSWSTCVSQSGGTPGKRNSLFVDAYTGAGSISIAPNPFSPDGDGIDDFTFISYSFPVPSVKIRVRIFDSIGRLIASPEDNVILPPSGKMVWDGRNGSGEIVRFGLYILLVEVTGPDGKSLSVYKKPLIVAKRMR